MDVRLDLIPDSPDHRDNSLCRVFLPKLRPKVISLEGFLGPVADQGPEGSCFAFAGVGLREFLARSNPHQPNEGSLLFSAEYLFYKVHELEGTLNQDCGGSLRTVMQVLNKHGVCLDSTEPYNIAGAWITPKPSADAEAQLYRGGAYHRLCTVDDMKSCLASGYVFVAGFNVKDSFMRDDWWENGTMPSTGLTLGGHAVLFFGYDDDRQAFHVRNSWGPDWCQNGNFWFPYQQAADSSVLWDAWIQHLGKAW